MILIRSEQFEQVIIISLYHIDDELDHGICELLTIYNYTSEDMGKWKLESTGACV